MYLQRLHFIKKKTYKTCYRMMSTINAPDLEVDNIVIGGGVIGLAIAEKLTRERPFESTILVEKNKRLGEETRYSTILILFIILNMINIIMNFIYLTFYL